MLLHYSSCGTFWIFSLIPSTMLDSFVSFCLRFSMRLFISSNRLSAYSVCAWISCFVVIGAAVFRE